MLEAHGSPHTLLYGVKHTSHVPPRGYRKSLLSVCGKGYTGTVSCRLLSWRRSSRNSFRLDTRVLWRGRAMDVFVCARNERAYLDRNPVYDCSCRQHDPLFHNCEL